MSCYDRSAGRDSSSHYHFDRTVAGESEGGAMSDKRIQIAATDEANGPGSGGQRLSVSVWVRFPGGPWMGTSESSRVKVQKALRGIGLDASMVHRDIDLHEEIRERLKP